MACQAVKEQKSRGRSPGGTASLLKIYLPFSRHPHIHQVTSIDDEAVRARETTYTSGSNGPRSQESLWRVSLPYGSETKQPNPPERRVGHTREAFLARRTSASLSHVFPPALRLSMSPLTRLCPAVPSDEETRDASRGQQSTTAG